MYLMDKKVGNEKQSLEVHFNHCLSHSSNRIFKELKFKGIFTELHTHSSSFKFSQFFSNLLSLSIKSTKNYAFRIKII